MSDRVRLAEAVRRIALGYVLLHLNINLGTLDILPDWVGHCLILSSLPVLAGEEKSAALLKPFGMILTVWSGLQWIFSLFGDSWDGGILGTVIAIVGLYYHFQLLTNLAAISEKYGCPETGRILTLRTVLTVIDTVFSLPLPWEDWEVAVFLLCLIMLVAMIWICRVLFSLRRSLTEDTFTEPEP